MITTTTKKLVSIESIEEIISMIKTTGSLKDLYLAWRVDPRVPIREFDRSLKNISNNLESQGLSIFDIFTTNKPKKFLMLEHLLARVSISLGLSLASQKRRTITPQFTMLFSTGINLR